MHLWVGLPGLVPAKLARVVSPGHPVQSQCGARLKASQGWAEAPLAADALQCQGSLQWARWPSTQRGLWAAFAGWEGRASHPSPVDAAPSGASQCRQAQHPRATTAGMGEGPQLDQALAFVEGWRGARAGGGGNSGKNPNWADFKGPLASQFFVLRACQSLMVQVRLLRWIKFMAS